MNGIKNNLYKTEAINNLNSNININLITEHGYQLLKTKLVELEKESKIIARRLSFAKMDGDLSENADYNALKEKLEVIHDKIYKIRQDINNSKVITGNDNNNDSVRIGNKVKYTNLNTNETLEIEIASEVEANPFINRISYKSPLGLALMNKKVGEIISITNSKNLNAYQIKILEIK